MTALGRRWLLTAFLLLTLGVVLLDLSGSAVPGHLKTLGGAAAGPVQRVLADVDKSDATRLREENATLRTQLAQSGASLAEAAAVAPPLRTIDLGRPARRRARRRLPDHGDRWPHRHP